VTSRTKRKHRKHKKAGKAGEWLDTVGERTNPKVKVKGEAEISRITRLRLFRKSSRKD
jgi:hypothetical protein